MAKKKGTLKDMVKAPRTIDIDGQLHMLAWITPEEGKTLKQLGGAGKKGPMGIPAYPPQGMVDAMGGSATGVSNTSQGGNTPDGGSKGGTGLGSFATAAGETVDKSRPEFGRGGVADIENVQNYVMNEEGKIVGAYHQGSLPGVLGMLADAFGLETTVYSGDSAYGPGSQKGPGGDRGGPDKPMTAAVSVAPVEEEEEDTPLTKAMKDYYTMGVGTGTQPSTMTDIISSTESPIGSRYDKEKGLLYLADGTIIDVKTGKRVDQSKIKPLRISGLEMFKPIGE